MKEQANILIKIMPSSKVVRAFVVCFTLTSIYALLHFKFRVVNGRFPSASSNYVNHRTLVSPDIYDLYWNISEVIEPIKQEELHLITAELHVKNANGWIGFGISPNGGMQGSDIITAWMDIDGKCK